MTLKEIWNRLNRVLFEISLLCIIGVILFAMPLRIERQGLELFLYKVLLFSASQIHAHVARKLIFPYIDFRKSAARAHQYVVIAMHLSAAYLYGVGG